MVIDLRELGSPRPDIHSVAEAPSFRKRAIVAEPCRIAELKSRHKLAASRKNIKSLTIAKLSKEFKLEQEYKSLYKLFSKIVHPSSCLVNGAALFGYT